MIPLLPIDRKDEYLCLVSLWVPLGSVPAAFTEDGRGLYATPILQVMARDVGKAFGAVVNGEGTMEDGNYDHTLPSDWINRHSKKPH